MIPIKADENTRQRYIDNILARYRSATQDQLDRGRAWYRTAHQLAGMLTAGNHVAGAGVLAALSANKSWGENTRLAARAFLEGRPSGHVGDALRKAARIMAGEHPEAVLPMHSKTGQFFLCIADPGHAEAVVVDRHAHDVAVGEVYGDRDRGLSSKGRYDLLADCYREAARQCGELPQVVQAVTWVAHIECPR